MNAIVWLLNAVGKRMKKKVRIISTILFGLLLFAFYFMDLSTVLWFLVICWPLIIERMFFDEIARNNIIPLKVICGDKISLTKCIIRKTLCLELPCLLGIAIISVIWSCLHYISFVHVLWYPMAIALLFLGGIQCGFIHVWLMFLNNNTTTWFEIGIFVILNLVFQLTQMFGVVVQIAVILNVLVLLVIAIIGKAIIFVNERRRECR